MDYNAPQNEFKFVKIGPALNYSTSNMISYQTDLLNVIKNKKIKYYCI